MRTPKRAKTNLSAIVVLASETLLQLESEESGMLSLESEERAEGSSLGEPALLWSDNVLLLRPLLKPGAGKHGRTGVITTTRVILLLRP